MVISQSRFFKIDFLGADRDWGGSLTELEVGKLDFSWIKTNFFE